MTAIRERIKVSTHSRLKAAAVLICLYNCHMQCFNTQPPEGGWQPLGEKISLPLCFNTQPPEGGWILMAIFNVLTQFQHTAA